MVGDPALEVAGADASERSPTQQLARWGDQFVAPRLSCWSFELGCRQPALARF